MTDAVPAPTFRSRLWPRHAAGIVFLAACVVYGFRLGAPGLIARDEPRYAVVAREMLQSGDYVTPRFNGLAYLEKPPLFHWMNAASFAILGINEFAMRLPTMLCAAATTALVFCMGRRVYGLREGLLAAVVLGSCLMWFVMARCARFDMPLSLAVTAAAWWAWLGSEGGRQGRHYYVYATVAAALAILVKGPVGLVIPGLTFLVYLAGVRRLRALADVPWPAAIAILALLVVPWFAACEAANPGATVFFLHGRNVWRLTREVDAPHQQPWWHTIMFLVGGVLPWSVCLPGALWQARREARGEDTPPRRLSLLLLASVVVTVALYLPPPVKFFQYVMPALPALALLLGRHVAGVGGRGRWSLAALGVFTVLFGIALWVLGRPLLARLGLPSAPLVPTWVTLALAGGVAAAVWGLRGRRLAAAAAVALALTVPLHVADYVLKDADPHIITDKPVVLAAARHAGPGDRLVCYGYTPCAAVFYYPGRVVTVGYPVPEYMFPGNEGHLGGVYYPTEEAESVFAQPPAMVGLAKSRDWDELQARLPERVQFVESCEPYVIFRTVPARPGRRRLR